MKGLNAASVGVSTPLNIWSGIWGSCVQSQYGIAKSALPLSSRIVRSNQPRYPRCQAKNHQLPCGQSIVWMNALRNQLRASVGGSASIFSMATA